MIFRIQLFLNNLFKYSICNSASSKYRYYEMMDKINPNIGNKLLADHGHKDTLTSIFG